MKITNNVIKSYLKNVLFINGTAYAGKSTMCKMLSEKYDLLHCEENYCMDKFLAIATPKLQPNMSYFKINQDWQKFLNRAPQEYEAWIDGNSREIAEFEILELIQLSKHNKVIVDTNIPIDILKEIADYHQVAVLLSPQSMSVDYFSERKDPEKLFLLDQIQKAENPKKTMDNFKACLAQVNSNVNYKKWLNSGFYTIIRENTTDDTRLEVLSKLANHFKLND